METLREVIDLLNRRKLEILSGKEREDLLAEIIQQKVKMRLRFPKLLS